MLIFFPVLILVLNWPLYFIGLMDIYTFQDLFKFFSYMMMISIGLNIFYTFLSIFYVFRIRNLSNKYHIVPWLVCLNSLIAFKFIAYYGYLNWLPTFLIWCMVTITFCLLSFKIIVKNHHRKIQSFD